MTPAIREIDVSSLPTDPVGVRNVVWWGQALMMIIEGTLFALIVASYFYVRIGFENWPTPNEKRPDLFLPTLGLFILIISLAPMEWATKSAEHHKRSGVFWGTLLNLACVAAFLVCRWIELVRLDFKWNTDIYGSFVWCILGLHTMHAIADGAQTLVMFAILLSKKAGEKQIVGFRADGQYWWFVVVIWIPLYFVIYVHPRLAKW